MTTSNFSFELTWGRGDWKKIKMEIEPKEGEDGEKEIMGKALRAIKSERNPQKCHWLNEPEHPIQEMAGMTPTETSMNIPREAELLHLKHEVLCAELFAFTPLGALSQPYLPHNTECRDRPERSDWMGSEHQSSFSLACFHTPGRCQQQLPVFSPSSTCFCQF